MFKTCCLMVSDQTKYVRLQEVSELKRLFELVLTWLLFPELTTHQKPALKSIQNEILKKTQKIAFYSKLEKKQKIKKLLNQTAKLKKFERLHFCL